MVDKYNQAEDILSYLKANHIGAENCVQSTVLENAFGISGVEVRHIVNKLQCDGRPVCSNVNGYFYAQNHDEINNTIAQLLGRTKKINDAAQGLVISHQVFYDGMGVTTYEN